MMMKVVQSSKPKRQRKWHYSKPLHALRKDFSMHLSKELRKQIGKRSLEARKGDTVKIMRGDSRFAGKHGKIVSFGNAKRQVFIEGIVGKKVSGVERLIPFRASNLLLVALEEKDARRIKGKKKAKAETAKMEAKK